MERRRRERINGCLEQLKNYVLLAEGKDVSIFIFSAYDKFILQYQIVLFHILKPESHSCTQAQTIFSLISAEILGSYFPIGSSTKFRCKLLGVALLCRVSVFNIKKISYQNKNRSDINV